jgi:hypothetical protein
VGLRNSNISSKRTRIRGLLLQAWYLTWHEESEVRRAASQQESRKQQELIQPREIIISIPATQIEASQFGRVGVGISRPAGRKNTTNLLLHTLDRGEIPQGSSEKDQRQNISNVQDAQRAF